VRPLAVAAVALFSRLMSMTMMRNLEDYLDACLFFGSAEKNFRVFVHALLAV
jgi:hypothetical protein